MKRSPEEVTAIVFAAVMLGFVIMFAVGWAHAAETLPAVSPPTDWTFVIAAAVVAVVFGLVVVYVQWAKRRPGMQPGEEMLNRLLDSADSKDKTIAEQAATIASLRAAQPTPTSTQPPAKYPADWT